MLFATHNCFAFKDLFPVESINTKVLSEFILISNLEWKTHVNVFAAKISKSVGLFYLPSKSLLTHYTMHLFIPILVTAI